MFQSCQIFLGETIFLVSPLVKIHTGVIVATSATEESHAILGSAIASTHDIVPTSSLRCRSIYSADAPGSVFPPIVGDVQTHYRSPARRSSLHKDHFRDLPILAEELVGSQSRYELFFGKPSGNANDIHDVPLNHSYIGQLTSPKTL